MKQTIEQRLEIIEEQQEALAGRVEQQENRKIDFPQIEIPDYSKNFENL
jgi:hypothetical protein